MGCLFDCLETFGHPVYITSIPYSYSVQPDVVHDHASWEQKLSYLFVAAQEPDPAPDPSASPGPGGVVQVEEGAEEDAKEVAEEDDTEQLLSGMSACDFEEDFDRHGDIEKGYMFAQEDFDRIKFETESVKKMWELEVNDEITENVRGEPH